MPDTLCMRLIACSLFTRELCGAIERSEHIIDPLFLEIALHEHSAVLREQLQRAIDAAEGKNYSYILLGYGLCGNSLHALESRSIPLVMPRAHDCCTMLLGSRQRFSDEFGNNLSSPWSSRGYIERGSNYMHTSATGRLNGFGMEYQELVEKYGEENAEYLWETLHPEIDEPVHRYIEMDSTAHPAMVEQTRISVESQGKTFTLIQGNERMLHSLVNGPWDDQVFLVVPPHSRIEAVYDDHHIITHVPVDTAS